LIWIVLKAKAIVLYIALYSTAYFKTYLVIYSWVFRKPENRVFISFGNTYNFINDTRKWLGEDEEQVETNRKGEENQNWYQ